MSLPEFGYFAPTTVEEAIALLHKYGTAAKVIAGGSDLLHLMKRGAIAPVPQVVVDVKRVDGLRATSFDPVGGLSLGALVTIGDIDASEMVAENYPLLVQTADVISSPQVRNVATVGGALSQQVWCWFLRNGLKCWRAGGSTCYATLEGADTRYYHSVMGGEACYAVHPSDLAVALEALDASVTVAGPCGTKSVAIADFIPGNVWVGSVLQSHILSPSEMVTGVTVPPPAEDVLSTYVKSRIRNSFDFAIASVALRLEMEGGTVQDSRVVFGGVAPAPYRDAAVEQGLNGQALASLDPQQVAAMALAAATPLGGNGYKVNVARGVLADAIQALARIG